MRMKFAGQVNGDQYEGLPVPGRITDWYGRKRELSNGKGHTGNDIANSEGTPICAPMAGSVDSVYHAKENPTAGSMEYYFGNAVVLKHSDPDSGDFLGYSMYSHFAEAPQVGAGDDVQQGQVLGVMGSTGLSTGPHLHWSCTVNNNRWLTRAGGLNDTFSFLDTGEHDEAKDQNMSAKQKDIDARQKQANDLQDAVQSMFNDLIDEAQGLIDDYDAE